MKIRERRIPFLTGLIFLPLVLLQCQQSGEKNDDGGEIDAKGIYKERCASCHGIDGKKGLSGASDLTRSKLTMEERIEVIKNGRGSMIPFQGILSQKEIEAVARYLDKFKEAE